MYLVTTPLNTLHFRLPFTLIQTKSTLSSDSCRHDFALFTVQIMQRKHKDGTNKYFVALCILYVLNLLLNGFDNIKPFSVLCLHLLIHAL